MVLLVSSSGGVLKCAAILERGLGITAHAVDSIGRAQAALQREEFQAVVIDQLLLDVDPASVDSLLRHAGSAIVVFVNPAIHSGERVLREVRSAVLRRRHEEKCAMEAAVCALRNDLSGDVTGILLSSQLALAEPLLPAATRTKLNSICELAERVRGRLALPAGTREMREVPSGPAREAAAPTALEAVGFGNGRRATRQV